MNGDFNNGSRSAFGGLNSFVSEYLNNKSNYGIGEETNNIGTCFDKSYSSRFEPNECWASWWVEGINRKYCYYGELIIEKWDDRVKYNGVKLKIYAIQKNGASQDDGDQSKYPLSVDHTATVIYDQEIEAPWGYKFTFPIANNIIDFSIVQPRYDDYWGDWTTIKYYPYDSACENCSRVEMHIQIIGVI